MSALLVATWGHPAGAEEVEATAATDSASSEDAGEPGSERREASEVSRSPTGGAPPARPLVVTVGNEPRGFVSRQYGGRFALGVPSSSSSVGPTFGGAAYERAIGVFSGDGISVRYFDELWFGGDSADLTYSLDLDLAVGPEFGLSEGLFLRLRPAFRGTLRQESGLFLSSLRAPGLEVALGIEAPAAELDLAAHAAPNLAGEFSGFDEKNRLFGGAYGASLSATFWSKVPIRVDLDANVFTENPADAVVLETRNYVCAVLGASAHRPALRTGSPTRQVHVGARARDYRWSICGDYSLVRLTRPAPNNPVSVGVSTVGISVVLGASSRLDPHGKP